MTSAQQIITLDGEPNDLTTNDIPPIELDEKKRYLAYVLRWVYNGAKGHHEFAWFALGWECETFEDADNYLRRVYPNYAIGRYEIVEICTNKRIMPRATK